MLDCFLEKETLFVCDGKLVSPNRRGRVYGLDTAIHAVDRFSNVQTTSSWKCAFYNNLVLVNGKYKSPGRWTWYSPIRQHEQIGYIIVKGRFLLRANIPKIRNLRHSCRKQPRRLCDDDFHDPCGKDENARRPRESQGSWICHKDPKLVARILD